jgi:peptidoglycan/xylan/chitin deacetylase (PgdA/CDA1 family)/GT2 family glycosyltransferase
LGLVGLEVIVVDDGSKDETVEMLRSLASPCSFKYISQANCGAAAARNAGAGVASGRLIVFLDDDVVAAPGLIAAHCAMHARDPGGLVVGTVEMRPGDLHPAVKRVYRALRRSRSECQSGSALSAAELLTGNCSMDREQFLSVGGFDATLLSNEDLEFGLRLTTLGIPIRHCQDAVATEHYARGLELFLEDAWRRGYAHGQIMKRYPDMAHGLPLGRFFAGSLSRRLARRFAWTCAVVLRALGGEQVPRNFVGCWLAQRAGWSRLLLSAFNYWGGVLEAIGSLGALRRALDRRLLVLGYHIVENDVPPAMRPYAVSPARLEQHLVHLKRRGYQSVTLDRWSRFLEGRASIPDRPVAITFDDGDRETLNRIKPILDAHGFVCTCFVVAGALGGTNEWDPPEYPRRRLVDTADLVDTVERGWEVGSHGTSHLRLTQLTDDEQASETERSRRMLSDALCVPVRFYAYPFGNVDRRSSNAVRRAGYGGACGSRPGLNHPRTDRFRMRRVFVSDADRPLRFALTIRYPNWLLLPVAWIFVVSVVGRLRAIVFGHAAR